MLILNTTSSRPSKAASRISGALSSAFFRVRSPCKNRPNPSHPARAAPAIIKRIRKIRKPMVLVSHAEVTRTVDSDRPVHRVGARPLFAHLPAVVATSCAYASDRIRLTSMGGGPRHPIRDGRLMQDCGPAPSGKEDFKQYPIVLSPELQDVVSSQRGRLWSSSTVLPPYHHVPQVGHSIFQSSEPSNWIIFPTFSPLDGHQFFRSSSFCWMAVSISGISMVQPSCRCPSSPPRTTGSRS